MKVFISELAEYKLKQLTEYLLEEWSYKVKKDFLVKLTAKIEQISEFPESCQKSLASGGIYKCVVTKQTTFFYRVNFSKKEIEIITLFDTRNDPEKLKSQLQ
ncbi:type II toxin-antitoxin system RelE/ParE family toxin [Cellulophaga sp. F20128]|uniref:type II toxin-antitoxin system RelE/ParE family toxin n=1 Tax=Cellulophaga sp. F20128 TaxID=2926413 RepID=UPI001FF2A791|nr:type II toxin-antitoxin system RelE/ParE family toxin [Cellulophaga sp. F20128]MCK0155958.1 type II toxin-antitoxin system RelE/ParE family toxin [Cellulophaga sp. F20128]